MMMKNKTVAITVGFCSTSVTYDLSVLSFCLPVIVVNRVKTPEYIISPI